MSCNKQGHELLRVSIAEQCVVASSPGNVALKVNNDDAAMVFRIGSAGLRTTLSGALT